MLQLSFASCAKINGKKSNYGPHKRELQAVESNHFSVSRQFLFVFCFSHATQTLGGYAKEFLKKKFLRIIPYQIRLANESFHAICMLCP